MSVNEEYCLATSVDCREDARKMRSNLYVRMSRNELKGKGNKISLNQCAVSYTLQLASWQCMQHTTTQCINVRMHVCTYYVANRFD